MAYNSNRIEGSRLDEEQTRYIYETRTIAGDALPVDDIVETVNGFELFDAVLDRFDEPITTAVMKDYHRILKRGTADARRPSFAVGGWKRVPNVVGGRETVAPGRVGPAIEDLLARTPGSMTLDDATKLFYHRGLNEYEHQPGFLRETLRSLQDDYYTRFAPFVEVLDE